MNLIDSLYQYQTGFMLGLHGSSAEKTMQNGSNACCNLDTVFQQSLIWVQSFKGSLLEGLYGWPLMP